MRVLLSTLLLAAGILLCISFQMKAHQAYILDSFFASSSSSAISSSSILNISLKEEEEKEDDHKSLSSFRGDPSNKMIVPPTCQFHNIQNRTINRIYFLHMRKAGGSSLRSYFAHVAKKHGLKFQAAEGYLHPEQPGHDQNTLYITHVREPIARAISHYKYEKRWDCKTQLKHSKESFIPTNNNTIMSLYNFTITNHSMYSKLWTCASNCYARWVSGRSEHVVVSQNDDDYDVDQLNDTHVIKQQQVVLQQQLEHAARESLWKYNFIIVSEWLHQDLDYVKSIETIFGVQRLNRTRGMTCGAHAAMANGKVPLVIQSHELEVLRQVNQIDLKLYQELTSCQPQFLLQQQHDNDDDVNTINNTTGIQWMGTANTNKARQQKQRRQKTKRSRSTKNKHQEEVGLMTIIV